MKKILFKEIKFIDVKYNEFKTLIKKKGLFVFPSGFSLPNIKENNRHHSSLKKADFVFFDSGFFVLLLRFFKNINVHRFSGYKFLSLFFKHLKKNNKKSIFCIDPNSKFSKKNKNHFSMLGAKNVQNYVAPIYKRNKDIVDKKLLKKISKSNPNFILINLAGGIQEVLGLYLKKNLKFKTSIICTGGAISFFTGDQASINDLIDKLYIGWLVRLVFDPLVFFKRIIYALKLIPMVLTNKIQVIVNEK